jgi:antitoxin component YwqK of YwqJK toxin-antitoxin module
MGFIMTLTFYKKDESITGYAIEWNADGQAIAWSNEAPVMLWKFKDENGKLWNTETGINGTEDDAKQIILQSIANNG